jgi:hypothetical protein
MKSSRKVELMLLTCCRTSGRAGIQGARVWSLCVAISLLACADLARGGNPSTQPARNEKPTIEALVHNLANPDARVRESARTSLLRLGREDLPDLKRALKKARPLLPSQVSAVREIVRQVYLSGEEYKTEGRGFLGILMDPASDVDLVPDNDSRNLGIVVTDRIPGFCAGRGLLDGDIILGKAPDRLEPFVPFRNTDDLKRAIAPSKPGVAVHLVVLRQGEVMVLPLKPDPNPQEIGSPEQIPAFVAEREKHFAAYWQREFADLVAARVAG